LRFGMDFPILRTEEPAAIAAADIAFDVGGEWDAARGRFDHHQGETGFHPCGIPFASAGLLWSAYGREIVAGECPDAGEAGVELITEAVRHLCILPIDAWDNGIFPDFQGQSVLPFQTVVNASNHGGDQDNGYEIAVSLGTRMLRGFIQQRAESIRREGTLMAVASRNSSDPSLLRHSGEGFWLFSRVLRFPLQQTSDFLGARGITLRGAIQPNVPGRNGKWMVEGLESVPPIRGESYRSVNQRLVVAQDLCFVFSSLGIDPGTVEEHHTD